MESENTDELVSLAGEVADACAVLFTRSPVPANMCISSAALALVWLVRAGSSGDTEQMKAIFESLSNYFANRAHNQETPRKEALH